MLPWVYVFGGLQRKIETVKMKEKKIEKKKINDAEDEWEEDEKFGTKGKSNRWREGDFSTVMDVIRDEGDRELINFQLLVLFSLFRKGGIKHGGDWELINFQLLVLFSMFRNRGVLQVLN